MLFLERLNDFQVDGMLKLLHSGLNGTAWEALAGKRLARSAGKC